MPDAIPDKPYSPACDRNREPILALLRDHLGSRTTLLEICSGTGQHAVHAAAALPHLIWQCSDRAPYLPGIRAWLDEAGLPNTPPPIPLDVGGPWPTLRAEVIYSANTLHILSAVEVLALFAALPAVLAADAVLVIYGPFRYGGRHTSASNDAFDASLRARDPASGVRDFEWVDGLAQAAGLRLVEDRSMPANNRGLVWRRVAQ